MLLLLHMFPTGFVVDEDFDEVDALTPGRMDHGRGALRVWIERRTAKRVMHGVQCTISKCLSQTLVNLIDEKSTPNRKRDCLFTQGMNATNSLKKCYALGRTSFVGVSLVF